MKRAPQSPVRDGKSSARATPPTGIRGNQLMIAKVLNCADEAAAAHVKRRWDETYNQRLDRDRRAAAQAKRERKMAKRAAGVTT